MRKPAGTALRGYTVERQQRCSFCAAKLTAADPKESCSAPSPVAPRNSSELRPTTAEKLLAVMRSSSAASELGTMLVTPLRASPLVLVSSSV